MKDIGIIDIESSGLHNNSYPIEVAVLLRGECQSWLIKPEPGWEYWCTKAESVHGISHDQLIQDGLSAIEVAKQLNAFLTESDTVLYSDAYRWDGDWIYTLYEAAEIKKPFQVDTVYNLMKHEEADKFDEQLAQLEKSGKYRQHRAAEDVKMIYEAYCKAFSNSTQRD